MRLGPFTESELFECFHGGSMSSKHVLLIYSFIVGLNAKTILDLGLGNSTRVCRSAAAKTGGKVYSCDMDEERFKKLEELDEPGWEFFCTKSTDMIQRIPAPFDFVFHDASHIHDVVIEDLLIILPKMRQFGLVCVHDTQQPRYTLLEAVTEAVEAVAPRQTVSMLTLPFSCGLTVLRVETSSHDPITPAVMYRGDRVVTVPRYIAPPDRASQSL